MGGGRWKSSGRAVNERSRGLRVIGLVFFRVGIAVLDESDIRPDETQCQIMMA